MIAALRGTYRGRTDDGIVVDVNGIGYEVLLPPIVEQALGSLEDGRALDLRIAYIATRDNPVPVLYGFARDEERQFWDLLRSVSRVGPKSAARAMVLPIHSMAEAIRDQNTHLVDSLPGISAAGAEKIVASLRRKVERFTTLEEPPGPDLPPSDDELKRLATDLLVEMGIRRPDAGRAVAKLLEADPPPRTVEDVVMEYFKR
jgi:holliday junction DNA helicase RuvA